MYFVSVVFRTGGGKGHRKYCLDIEVLEIPNFKTLLAQDTKKALSCTRGLGQQLSENTCKYGWMLSDPPPPPPRKGSPISLEFVISTVYEYDEEI